MRTLLVAVAALLFCACTSLEGTTADTDTWTHEVAQGSKKVASATARGAVAVGNSVGTAYRGVTTGFEDPADKAYGPYPQNYVTAIRKHMLRFQGVDADASFKFGKPVRSYLNKGLLRGGDIEWQGWIVDVSIETTTAFGQSHTEDYVVRMNDGDVVEVLEAKYAGALRRVEPNSAPAATTAPAATPTPASRAPTPASKVKTPVPASRAPAPASKVPAPASRAPDPASKATAPATRAR